MSSGKEVKVKKDKKDKKEKHSEKDGVKKSKKDKKEKKEKKAKKEDATVAIRTRDDSDDEDEIDPAELALAISGEVSADALVPFANPLASQEQKEKVLKAVKLASKHKTLKRGVKEVQKALRKQPKSGAPASSFTGEPIGVVIIAADISPMDVISHLPVLCEDNNIPYIYLNSRAELGIAGNTKRATSVVMISKDKLKGKKSADAMDVDEEDGESWEAAYKKLVKLVKEAGTNVLV